MTYIFQNGVTQLRELLPNILNLSYSADPCKYAKAQCQVCGKMKRSWGFVAGYIVCPLCWRRAHSTVDGRAEHD